MNVLIVCSVGMSSSAIVKKLREEVHKKGLPFKVGSCSVNQLDQYSHQASIILLSPHTVHVHEELVKKHPNIKITDIPMKVYGNQDISEIIKIITDKNQIISDKKYRNKFRMIATSFSRNTIMTSINDGMMSTMSITIIGSILLLLKTLPFSKYLLWLQYTNLDVLFQSGIDVTTGLIAIHLTYYISYNYAKRLGISGSSAALNGLICFFLMLNRQQTDLLTTSFLGFDGIFYAMFVSIFVTKLFSIAISLNNHFKLNFNSIKNKRIIESLTGIIPTFICVVFSLGIVVFFQLLGLKSLPCWLSSSVQGTLALFVGNNIVSELILTSSINFLWFFGLHGGSIVSSITKPLYSTMAFSNMLSFSAKQNIPYMITSEFRKMYVFGGAGSTLGLAILMATRAKSQQMRHIGKISLPLGVFFINEPIMFGLPIVLNPIIALPFFVITPLCGYLTYLVMSLGMVPFAVGFDIPWSTPPIISGFIQGGIKLALWQGIMLCLSTIMWYPFFCKLDNKYYVSENNTMP